MHVLVGAIFFYIAATFIADNGELQSAISHEYFGKRVSFGAQVASCSYLALATREQTTIKTTALVHTLFCTKKAPEPAAAGRIESSTTAEVAQRTPVGSSSNSSSSKQKRTAKMSCL